jgi:type I restriction enzyme S subunit
MSELPTGWSHATIADTGKYINGFAFKPKHWGESGRPIIRIQNLTNDERDINRTTFVPSDEFIVRPGDILVSWSATLDAFIWNREEALLNQHIFRVIPETNVVGHRYLFYLLKEAIQEMQKTEHLHGSTMKHINRGPFMAHKIPLAPRHEQRRIVAEIEKQFTRLDDAVAALKRVQANLKRYRASVLKAACEGRLVPTEAELARKEGRSYEPSSELLKRILAERRTKWEPSKKYIEPNPPASDLPKLPEGWTWATLDQLLREPLRNGHSAKESSDGQGIRTLTLTAVTNGDFSESNVKTTVAIPERVRDLWIQPGDIFVERSNTPELVGIARLFDGPPNFAVFPDLLIRVRVSSNLVLKFIEALFLSERTRSYFRFSAQGISGSMPKIDQSVIEKLVVPLPPLAEQERIALELERHLVQLAATEQDIARGLRLAGHLRQAVLKSAFEGKLVPQDPNDEPASVLLERIRTERADASANKNGNPKATADPVVVNAQRRRRVKRLAHPVRGGKA